MDANIGLRMGMILTGVTLLGVTMSSLAKRRMTDSLGLSWELISVIFISAGLFLRPVELNRYISAMGILLVVAVGFCVVFIAYFMSLRISELMRRNLELAMQVTLLRYEVENMGAQEASFEGEVRWSEEAADCNQHAGAGRS